jgi:hypothetical protein
MLQLYRPYISVLHIIAGTVLHIMRATACHLQVVAGPQKFIFVFKLDEPLARHEHGVVDYRSSPICRELLLLR